MIRKLFIKYLTQDSETRDARRKEFNQAIFDAEKGFANYCGTDLDMVLEKFDKALAGFCTEIEKMGLTQNVNPYYFVEAGSYRPQGLQVYSDREIKLMREAFNVGRTAQLQKILNKLKEGAE